MGAQDLELFNNGQINRRLPVDGIKEVLEDLAARGIFEWSDKSKRRGLVFWNSPQQVGQDVYKWVTETGETNSWRGVSQEVLIKALKTLECDRKCEIFDVV